MRWRTVIPRTAPTFGAGPAPRITPREARVSPTPAAGTGDEVRTFQWRGHTVAFTRRGAGGLPVLLVHGMHPGASAFEWRHVTDALAAEHTVYTVDLLGFGRSARPRVAYGPRLYQALIADFAAQVVRQPVALVGAGRSAAYAIALAARDPGRFPAVIAIAPTGLIRATGDRAAWSRLRRALIAIPGLGTMLYHASVSPVRIRRWLERAYMDDDLVTDALVDAYHASARERGAKWARSALEAGRLDLDVHAAMRHLRQPLLVAWGARASHVPADEMLGFLALRPDAQVALIDLAGDLPHDERPGEFLSAARDFLARVGRDSGKRGQRLSA
jgi:pimeloyl-ACP methyl ester carboxylesterase